MISIQTGMLVALGFLIASLLGLLAASAFWARAVRLTTKRLKEAMPVSEPEIKADRDRLRAEYAIKVHKLETELKQAKFERARHLIEINRRDATISALETDGIAVRSDLEENQNARRVLEQTVADRLPRVEARLAEAKRLLFNRDREIAELTHGAKRQKLALEEATSINAQKNAQIDRLSSALTTRGSRQSSGEPRAESEVALRAEAEALRTKTREQAALIDRLQRRLEHGYVMPAPTAISSPSGATPQQKAQADAERARENLSEAEAALELRPQSRASGGRRLARARTRDKGFEGPRRRSGGRNRQAEGGAGRLRAGRQGRGGLEEQQACAQGPGRVRRGPGRAASRDHQ